MSAKNKKELSAQLEKKLAQERQRIEQIIDCAPEALYEYYEANYFGQFVGVKFDHEVKTLKELHAHLRAVSKNVGRYNIKSYWVPYKGLVRVDYSICDVVVSYSIYTDNEEAVIQELSAGKCKLVPVERLEVQCDIG